MALPAFTPTCNSLSLHVDPSPLTHHLASDPRIGRDDANDEGNEPLYRVYKVGPVKLYTVESVLRLLLHFIGSGSGDLEGIRRNVSLLTLTQKGRFLAPQDSSDLL